MLTFRMYATIKFNRAIVTDTDYISPGGFEMIMQGQPICFDFENYIGNVDKTNPSLLHIELRNPDYSSFEDLTTLTKEKLENVEEIVEFMVYTGESGESDLEAIAIEELVFLLPYDENLEIAVPQAILANAII